MASCSLCSRRVRPSSSCGCGSPMHRCAPAAAPRRATHCCACLWGSRRRAHARTHASPLRCAGCQPEPGHRPRHGHEGPHPHQLERSGAAARHRQRQGRPGHLQQAAAQEAAHPRQAHQEDHLRRVEQREQARARLRGPPGGRGPAHARPAHARPARGRPARVPVPVAAHRLSGARGLPARGLCRRLCLTAHALPGGRSRSATPTATRCTRTRSSRSREMCSSPRGGAARPPQATPRTRPCPWCSAGSRCCSTT